MAATEIPFRSLVAFEATARLGSVSRAADNGCSCAKDAACA
jgi:hypothetical protein